MSDSRHPLFGGVTLDDAIRIHRASVVQPWARKNLFHVTVESPLPVSNANIAANLFNVFCLGVDYAPVTLSGTQHTIGTAVADVLKAREAIELSLTTLDDTAGTLKSWFTRLARLAAPVDGTVNVPAKFATRFTIRHAFIDGDSGFADRALFRPHSMSLSLLRADQGMQELTLTFAQLDTFMPETVLPWALTGGF